MLWKLLRYARYESSGVYTLPADGASPKKKSTNDSVKSNICLEETSPWHPN